MVNVVTWCGVVLGQIEWVGGWVGGWCRMPASSLCQEGERVRQKFCGLPGSVERDWSSGIFFAGMDVQ